jgi:hypothetical protein
MLRRSVVTILIYYRRPRFPPHASASRVRQPRTATPCSGRDIPPDHRGRQQGEQREPIKGPASADTATPVRNHPHIGGSVVDVRFEFQERSIEVLDHLLCCGIKSAPCCVPQLDAFTHERRVAVSGIESARPQDQGMRRRVDDGQIDQRRDVVTRAFQYICADDG